MQSREHALNYWLKEELAPENFTLTPLSGDASFRRYFRLAVGQKKFVIMDAPPEKEPLDNFLFVQSILKQAQICVPECFAKETTQGFLMLSDFGDQLLLSSLTPENTQTSYQQSIDTIIQLQNIPLTQVPTLPHFNEAHIRQELSLFKDWFLQKLLGLTLTDKELTMIESMVDFLVLALTQQPQVFIHRDYHSRNIMRLENNELGIIDFQDAMVGPWTYDLVSLLKDCYIQWPQATLNQWIDYYCTHSPLIHQHDASHFMQSFELCGLQRHLKVLGIFSRLALRDNKTQYLNDLPLTLNYVINSLATQPELQTLYQFMLSRVKLP
jgi:N-acetylmuramate 1-kinase